MYARRIARLFDGSKDLFYTNVLILRSSKRTLPRLDILGFPICPHAAWTPNNAQKAQDREVVTGCFEHLNKGAYERMRRVGTRAGLQNQTSEGAW
jgi:hypothetical protein